jgi:hypothetical protein
MPCLVGIYDALRSWANPRSVSNAPWSAAKDCHDYYYQSFLTRSGVKKSGFKVCVCGGAGGIGQPLCLLMAQNPYVSELCVYDLTIAMVPAAGVATDLSHI